MTEEERDELASAYLDDEVTDDERDRVESDPALVERVAALRAVAAHLAAPVATPADRDRWIAAATRALPAPVAVRRPRWLVPAGAAAAVAACVALFVGLSRVTIGSGDDAAKTASLSVETDAAGGRAAATTAATQYKSAPATASAAAGAATADQAPSTSTAAAFGDYATDAELVAALRADRRSSAPTGSAPPALRLACAADGATLSARVAGRDVLIAIGVGSVTLTDAVTCERRVLAL